MSRTSHVAPPTGPGPQTLRPEHAAVAWLRPRATPGSFLRETLPLSLLAGALITFFVSPTFDGFFYGEEWYYPSLLLQANGDFIRAIFTPFGPFTRPAIAFWMILSDLVLPRTTQAQYIWNLILIVANIILLHRIMLRLTSSVLARTLGIAFFAVSKLFITLVGAPHLREMMFQLLHDEALLLTVILFLQERRQRYYYLSLVLFTITIFSRDTSIALLGVVVGLMGFAAWYRRTESRIISSTVLRCVPYACLVAFYFAARAAIVGPQALGSGPVYSLQFNPLHIAFSVYSFVCALLNLTNGNESSWGVDIPWVVFGQTAAASALRWTIIALSLVVALWAFVPAIRRKPWAIFCLLWMAAIVGPVSLTGAGAVYYAYEVLAATSLLSAIALDGHIFRTRYLIGAFASVIVVAAANGYVHNQSHKILGWRFVSDRMAVIFQEALTPNANSDVRSITLVVDDTNFVGYMFVPFVDNHKQYAILWFLFPPARTPGFQFTILGNDTLTRESGSPEAGVQALQKDDQHKVYVLRPNEWKFDPVEPTSQQP